MGSAPSAVHREGTFHEYLAQVLAGQPRIENARKPKSTGSKRFGTVCKMVEKAVRAKQVTQLRRGSRVRGWWSQLIKKLAWGYVPHRVDRLLMPIRYKPIR